MRLPLYQVDAFTTEVFRGNPAAVCPLTEWLPEATMMAIAQENNLAETAFFVPIDARTFHLRWFTPDKEVDLCGHGTLATAFTIFNHLNYAANFINFQTASGILTVTRDHGSLTMDFPARMP